MSDEIKPKKKKSKKAELLEEVVETKEVAVVDYPKKSLKDVLAEKIENAKSYKIFFRGKLIGDAATGVQVKLLDDGIIVNRTKYPYQGIDFNF